MVYRSVLWSVVGKCRACRSLHIRYCSCHSHSLRYHLSSSRLSRRTVSRLATSAAMPLCPRRPLLVWRRNAVQAARHWSPVAEACCSEHVRCRARTTADVRRPLRRSTYDHCTAAATAAKRLQSAEVCGRARTETEQSVCRRTNRSVRSNSTATAATA